MRIIILRHDSEFSIHNASRTMLHKAEGDLAGSYELTERC
jgi:hypothetical protein